MKTKGFIYLFSLIFVLLMASCEEDHIMTKYGDSASFLQENYVISVKSDFEYLEIPVTHKSINTSGSKYEIEVILGENTTSDMISVDQTLFDFDNADTLVTKLSIDYSKLTAFVNYSVILKNTNAFLETSYDGYDSVIVSFGKYSKIYDWVGTYSVAAVSYLDPGNWDESWDVITKAIDATHIEIIGISGSDVPVTAVVNTDALTISIAANTAIGDPYDWEPTFIYSFDGSVVSDTDPVLGTLSANGDMFFPYIGIGAATDNMWDVFTPTFTKN